MALQDVQELIRRVAEAEGLDEQEVEALIAPDAEHRFKLKLQNGNEYEAYRIQHDNRRGPYKGGLRFHPDVDLDEATTLATLMTLKTAAVGIPMGGGKGGISVDPKQLSRDELEELSRAFARELQPHIGPDTDVPAPDVNTNPQIIDWMVDEYEKLTGETDKASFTGKSLEKGGSEGRTAATGRGGVFVLREILKAMNWSDWPLSVAVQGFGNVSSYFATVAQAEHKDWRLVAATDSSGGVRDTEGLDATKLSKYKQAGNKLHKYEQGEKISDEDIFALDVDVLVLGALDDAINEANMQDVRAKIILEVANGPVSSKAREYLNEKGIVVVPDILANAGGVVVSYLEWRQNLDGERWPEDKVNTELERFMVDSTNAAWAEHEKSNTPLHEATIALALKRLLKEDKL